MRQFTTYSDAVALLGGPSKIVSVLDTASSVALFGMGAIDLFDARAEAVRLGDVFIRRLRDKVKGLGRYDTTRRLAAAHSVIVVTAYLEVLGEMDVLRELTPEDQRAITRFAPFASTSLPMPAPAQPYERVLHELEVVYRLFTQDLTGLLSGLACWDAWDETTRDRLRNDLPARSIRRYEELFRRLTAEFPEVACWVDRIDHQATRTEIGRLARGLIGIEERLARLPATRGPADKLAALIRSNRAVLGHPIVSSARTPSEMTIPTLEHGYIDPGYRLLKPAREARVASEETWAELPRRDDLDVFLLGHLTAPQATETPLLVLGQPGAGKSVLTRVLAARLPAEAFVPLRIELRGVPADSDVLGQIEHGIRAALDEPMSWPEFGFAAQGALPVVMLDGFDELLQATGVNQTDYLERVVRFQRAQAERGRALAVIVTSRTAVADRARVPVGTPVLRLEPFDDDQIRQWVTTWNHGNDGYFRERGLRPLPVFRVLAVRDLAEQPLLLLMLALYDADANALWLMREDLHEAELYERLLHGFAAREVGKMRKDLTDEELSRAVEDELHRLSITAFAMFNRGLQWISEHDLEADLQALWPQEAQGPGLRRPLTRAENVIGGFFFIHTTQALREEVRLKTYEFLHATFGEYLVARLVVNELADMAEQLASAESRRRPTRPEDSFLHALLSFAALAGRAPIVDFLTYGLRHAVPPEPRALLTRHLCELFSESLMARLGSSYDAYRPVRAEVTARCAAYSVNLMLLAVLSADEPLTGTELFRTERAEEANELWRRVARLWHSQLTRAEWESLIQTVVVRHSLQGERRTMRLEFGGDPVYQLRDLAFFTWPGNTMADFPYQSHEGSELGWMQEISFRDDTMLAHLYVDLVPYMAHVHWQLDAHPHTRVADLLAVLLSDEPGFEQYQRAIVNAPSRAYIDRVLKQLEVDARRLPPEAVLTLMQTCSTHYPGPLVRLQNVLRVLKDRPDADWEMVRRAAALVRRQAQDQQSLRPLLDPEISPMRPGDVAGDGQPQSAPPGVP